MEAPGFWDNPEISNQKMKELKNLQDSVKAMHDLETQYEDIAIFDDSRFRAARPRANPVFADDDMDGSRTKLVFGI